MDTSSPHAGKGHNISRNVQVSCLLLELRGRHVVVFQVKVLQVAHVRQLVGNVLEGFTFWISVQNRDFFRSLTRVS